MPVLMEVHHDTEVGTGKPIDVNVFVIELQVLNSDGDLEPEGLQIFNYFTSKAVDPNTVPIRITRAIAATGTPSSTMRSRRARRNLRHGRTWSSLWRKARA